MHLTSQEQQTLQGKDGPVLQKIMQTLVLYGRALNAERFVEIEWGGHFALHHVLPGIGPRLEMLQELVDAGLKTRIPFTVDPFPPLDFENLALSPEQQRLFTQTFASQERFNRLMLRLGLRARDAFTCTPYLPEVGNVPPRGAVLAWSESSAVIYANSVLGARSNRNAVILDLLSNLLGKTPFTGLLTDEGRRATWKIEVHTTALPDPQLLGGMIGKKILADIPWISGLQRFLDPDLNDRTRDYLKEMGAACAAIGAVGLYHIENITPEAVDLGRDVLLTPGYQTYTIDDRMLEQTWRHYPVMWADPDARPQRCLIGCPHLSLPELYAWFERIEKALRQYKRITAAVPTLLAAAPQVIAAFKADTQSWEKLSALGIRLSPTCLEALMQNPLVAQESVVTNSNKLRYFTRARYLPDAHILKVIAGRGWGAGEDAA
jgi:predicted aconitase